MMAGSGDFVSVRENGVKVQKQKRMLLSNLDSLYTAYMDNHGQNNPLGFSKFAQLRPRHCVLAGSPGTHSVCVCVYHENIDLMFEGARIKEAPVDEDIPLNDVKSCMKQIMCEEPSSECYLRECENCPSPDLLKEKLLQLMEKDEIETVTYRGWFKSRTKRYHLEKVSKPVEDFLELFMESLVKLLPHHFITKEQSKYYQFLKENLTEGQVLVVCDFAENYTCVMQNEIQGYHWTQEQITIHPFVAYYRHQNKDLQSVCYAAVTDHKKHITASFHAFQKKYIPFVDKKMADNNVTCKKFFYFSDGCSGQYKNRKNVKNVCHHEEDFNGMKVEWHFFASCHGKGPCDGVGGTIKRCAARASLQGKIIRNAKELFDWAKDALPNIAVDYFTV
jgi:hypothetical protein